MTCAPEVNSIYINQLQLCQSSRILLTKDHYPPAPLILDRYHPGEILGQSRSNPASPAVQKEITHDRLFYQLFILHS